MHEGDIADLIRMSLFVAAEVSAPLLIVTLIIGLGMSIFQSVTQITDSTLIFIPKLVCFSFIFAFTFPWMLKIMTRFTYYIIFDRWDAWVDSINLVQ